MQTIKDYRVEIDRCINTSKLLTTSREVALAHTNLQRAKMWSGKALGETGATNPYPNSVDASNKIIEPQADQAPDAYFLQPEWDQTQKVKELRSIFQRIANEFEEMTGKSETCGKKYELYLQQSILALEESKMWLGWELDRIRIAELKYHNELPTIRSEQI